MKSAWNRVPVLWLVLLTMFSLAAPRAAFASEPSPPRAAPKTATLATSLITPFFGAYYLEGKFRASSSLAVLGNASYLSIEDGDWKNRAGTVGAGLDYFFAGEALDGWYAEAIAEIWFSSARHEPSGGVAPIGLGYAAVAVVGYQFVFDCGATIDLGAGGVVFHLPGAEVETAASAVSSEPLTRVYPAVKVNLGWTF